MIFLIMQPILELILNLFGDNSFSIAGISVATLLRFGIFAVILILAVVANFKKKSTIFFMGYLAICAVYIFIHQFNIRGYEFLVDDSVSYNIIKCGVFVARYIMPVCIMFLVFILEFNYKNLKISALGAASFVIAVVIITNLIGKDFIAYRYGSTEPPYGNIISWFSGRIYASNWRMYTSRGLFESGNSLAAFLSMTLPVTVYVAIKEKKNWLFIFAALQMITMLMCGTRISVYGAILLTGIVICIWIFDLIFNKKKVDTKKIISLVCLVAVFGTFFYFSPFASRMKSGEGFSSNHTQIRPGDEGLDSEIDEFDEMASFDDIEGGFTDRVDISKFDYPAKLKYIAGNYHYHYIPSVFVHEIYDYKDHADFWFNFMTNVDFSERNNSRKIKTLILKDMLSNKGNSLDMWVGIGETRVYPEADFTFMYYSYGIIGLIIFLAPFILILILSILSVIIRLFKHKFDALNCVLILSLGFTLITAFYAGHTLIFYFINILAGLISGMLLGMLKTKEAATEQL